MIAWKLTTDFDEQRHLFFEKIKTDYIVESYLCSCGHIDFIIKYPKQELKYICEECENTTFHDANNAWLNIGHYLDRNLDLECSYEYNIEEHSKNINSIYVTSIPTKIDLSSRKIIFSKKPVYTLSLSADGELSEHYILNFNEEILSKLKNNLTQYINENNCFNIPDSGERNLTLSTASFFLKNKHLKDFDFYYWNKIEEFESSNINIDGALEIISNYPKAKSVRKAYYKHYVRQLYDNNCFFSSFLEAFCKNIKDVNILVKLLDLKFNYLLYKEVEKEALNLFLKFLTVYYSGQQILKLFSGDEFYNNIYMSEDTLREFGRAPDSNVYMFVDTLKEFSYVQDLIENKFIKVPCKVKSLHDEFVRCSREERHKDMKNQSLAYSKQDMKPCIEANTYQVKLPKSGKELFDWADELHNCMAGYFEMIKNNETIIYCFFQENILMFAVEISDKTVVQASGKYNSDLTVKQNEIFTKWFELFFQEDKQVIINVA